MDNALARARRSRLGAHFAQVRALLAVYHPSDALRLQGAEMSRTGGPWAQRWVEAGSGQLAQLLTSSGLAATTVVSHAARLLLRDAVLRRRHGARLLEDAASLG